MDDTARLVSDLHQKLAHLDGKVAAYQRDMLAEFHRYMDDCLKNYPVHVSSEVSRVMAESMHKYPALTLMARDARDARDAESPRPQSPTNKILDSEALPRDVRKSPPPILYHTSGTPKEGPRSPHEREREFQGLFTPRYLPLLDSTHRGLQSPPESPVPTPLPLPLSQDNVKKVEDFKEPEAMLKLEIRPTPVRRMTDRSSSSVESSASGSDSKLRRSALRRSSSSTKGSPRRVRFEFAGEEVFPSTSPQDTSAVTVPPLFSGDDGADGAQTPPPPPPQLEAAAPIIPSINEPPAYSGTSLLDVEGEEDALPRPKKVSSTQALRALSRNAPLDAGTWTEVNADLEETPKMNGGTQENSALQQDQPSGQFSGGMPQDGQRHEQLHPQAENLTKHKVETKSSPLAHHVVTQQPNGDQSLGSPLEELQRDEDDDSSDDDEFLSMKPKKKPISPTIRSSFGRLPTISETAQNTARSSPNNAAHTKSPAVDEFGKGKVVDDVPEDAFFDFEGEGISTGVESDTEKYIAEDDSDDDDNDAAASKIPPEERPRVASIASGSNAQTEPAPVRKIPPATPSAALFGHSVGSYKGTSMRMNPISNPKLYDEIAGMRNVHTFVGSVDGRSGVEAIDMGSYRAYLVKNHASATPRSFTERLAFEEAMERRRSMRDSDNEDV
ncbi:hypothetical protein B0H65DRAFT_430206 [Neurospora tetraspora]|uniref:Uncharacterized protein n=1 Tax=Neurospora tetraspora TaxID=94610 RepID=A0AAE0JC52_9PEZI|nr:hypothetical protein B0H65DRAFT_430206 [Neurospora tetraspora]